jgi:hypothetical protein
MSEGNDSIFRPKGGVPMGCPLAGLCFVYALHQAIHATNTTIRDLDRKANILAYMDDMYIMVHPEHLKQTMENI